MLRETIEKEFRLKCKIEESHAHEILKLREEKRLLEERNQFLDEEFSKKKENPKKNEASQLISNIKSRPEKDEPEERIEEPNRSKPPSRSVEREVNKKEKESEKKISEESVVD